MAATQKFTIILFRLPDGRYVLQRRTDDAPYGAGLLGIFGGWVEDDETPDACIRREIAEETSLDAAALPIKRLRDFVIPASSDFDRDRQFYLYEAAVSSADFAVYEGKGAEAYSLAELKLRHDLTGSAQQVIDTL